MKEIPFSTVLTALSDSGRAFPARHLERFSDLSPQDLQALLQAWPGVSPERKRSLLKDLVERYREDTLLCFDEFAGSLLNDPDSQLRVYALQLLEETRDSGLISKLTKILENDPEPAVRAAAAGLLGRFVQMGEMEEIPAAKLKAVVACLLAAASDPDAHLARVVLELLGYASHPEVPALITAAFNRPDPQWQAAALRAAKNTADGRWQEQLLAALGSEDQPVRLAAVEAAGELGSKSARQLLIDMLDEEEDDEVLQAIIWSLSLIGGEDVRTYLQTLLDDAEDDDMLEFLEDALLNFSFTEDNEAFDLLAFDPDEPEQNQ